MALIGNVQSGYYKSIPLKEAIPAKALGSATRIALTGIDPLVDGFEASVVSLYIAPSSFDVTIPNGTVVIFDEITLLQLVQQIRIATAPNSPWAKASPNGRDIVPNLDGYTWGFLQQAWSGQPSVLATKSDVESFSVSSVAAGNDVLTMTDLATAPRHRESSEVYAPPPQYCGPFGEANAHVGDVVENMAPVFQHCFVRDGEEPEDWAFPLRDLLGKPAGNCDGSGGAGEIDVTFANSIDGFAVVWHDAAPTVDVWAECWVHGDAVYPGACAPAMVEYQAESNVLITKPGPCPYLFIHKTLNAGAMQTHDYSTIEVQENGKTINETNVTNMLRYGLNRSIRRPRWRPTVSESTVTGLRAKARLSRNGVPLVMVDGSLMNVPGNLETGLRVRIVTSGETSHRLIALHMIPGTVEVRKRAADWAGLKLGTDAIGVTKTRSGSRLDGARGLLLPWRLQRTLPSVLSPNKP